MPQATRMRRSSVRILALGALAVALVLGCSLAVLKARAGTSLTEQSPPTRPIEHNGKAAGTTGDDSEAAPETADESRGKDRLSHTSRSPFYKRLAKSDRAQGSESWYLGMAVIALVLALGGGLAAAARRLSPRSGAAGLQVVSRVSLSPKHSVYLLRAGTRVLLVGTGPQGAPALISELDEIPTLEPATGQGVEA
jgi:flagellar biogenesis protein FliO